MDLLVAVSDQVALAIDRKKAQEKIKENQKLTTTLLSISNAINTTENIDELYQSIFDSLNQLIRLPNFFISIIDRKLKKLHFPFFIDEYDSDSATTRIMDYNDHSDYISLEVINNKKAIKLDEKRLKLRAQRDNYIGKVPKIWFGVPLQTRKEVIGVMAVQHYHDPDYFSQEDMDIFIAVSGQVALALDKKQYQIELKSETKKTEQANRELKREIQERKRSENINETVFAITNAVNTTLGLDELYQYIHHLLKPVIDVTNFFIGIMDEKEQTLFIPFYVDTVETDFSPIPKFYESNALSNLVISGKAPLLLEDDELKTISAEKGIIGAVPRIWMGAPLVVKGKVIGLIAIQNYNDPNSYNAQDLQVLSSVSDQIATAIDRKKAEDDLRESENRYRHLFNNAPTAMYEIDFIKNRFINVNKSMCKDYGYSKNEFLSMNPLKFFTRQNKKVFSQNLNTILRAKKYSKEIELDIYRKDGQKQCVILNSDYLFQNDKITGARVVVHDITERKQIEEMMIQSEKMMSVGGLAAGMAHEINNPLAGIMQNIQVIQNRLTNPIPANEKAAKRVGTSMIAINDFMKERDIFTMLENSHAASINAAKIVKNMLSFARKSDASKSSHQISDLFEKALELSQSDYNLKKKYDFRHIKIVKEIATKIPMVSCEESKILQVLFNIIKNAAEAMFTSIPKTENPMLTFRAFEENQMVVAQVIDNGPGMEEGIRRRIFEPFFTTKGTNEGTGLGLSLSYFIIVDDHKGEMAVQSTIGRGSTFIIKLPYT